MTVARRTFLAGVTAVSAAKAASAFARPRKGPPKSVFLWGAATAAHQIEGNNVNSDYWVLEHIPDTYFKEPSGDACDSFARWREDLALVRLGGLNCYRFSVEWARIEPEAGEFSQATLDHYRRICIACREYGIEPVVTFHHFTSPRWIAALGGWENPVVADHFARYCTVVAKHLGDVIGWACTMNEPNAQVTSYVIANGKKWAKQPAILAQAAQMVGSTRFGAYFLGDAFKVRDTCLDAHAKGREAIKAIAPHMKVGLTLALQELAPAPGGEALYRRVYENARAPFYAVAAKDEFIGVQTYNKALIGPDGYLPPAVSVMRDMWDRDASPGALPAVVREAHRASGAPVLVSENGLNSTDDRQRIRHLRASVEGLADAIAEGVPVLGYIHWSLLDNFEWGSGYVPRFGLVEVDRSTFRRMPKPSLTAYRVLVGEMRRRHRWA